MNPQYAGNWYPIEQIAEVTGASIRTLRRRLENVSEQNVRMEASRLGRPRSLYHFTVLPELAVHHREAESSTRFTAGRSSVDSVSSVVNPSSYAVEPAPDPEPTVKPPPKPKGASKDDLVRGELRLRAVCEFEERCKLMTREAAADATCRDWANRARTQTVQMTEYLPSGYRRSTKLDVGLGIFKPGTLRTWAGTYARTKDVLSLVDQKKAHVGRKAKDIPPELLSYIYGLSVSTARADVAKAVAWGKEHWTGPQAWPEVSIDTWRRRIKASDPRKAGKDLMHSLQRYRTNQTPDVEIDWTQIPYNGRFEIDDVQQDWYGLSSDMERFIRPYAYAVIRARTRQWVSFIASEANITDDQVAQLIGFTMVQSSGGIPDEWKLENRNVTAKGDIVSLLESLGCKVSHTSMDGGEPVFEGAVKDGSEGHPQGHSLVERGNQSMHEHAWNAPAQVGSDERRTSPSRTEAFLRMAREAHKRGEFVLVHGPEQWAARIRGVCEKHNNTPNGGLEEILDPETGEIRNMTPNECAKMLASHEVRLMDEKLLPLFATRGIEVKVTKNGIRLNNRSYGRFDEELKKFESVKAYVSDVAPDVAYIHELGRCVEGYVKAAPGTWDQFGEKRSQESHYRNQFEALMADAIRTDSTVALSAMATLSNPVETRPETVVAPEAMVARADRMQVARAAHRDRAATLDKRFEVPEQPAASSQVSNRGSQIPARARGRGILSRTEELGEHLAALGAGKDESWQQPE